MDTYDAPHRNVELKATDPDRARSLATCRELGATDQAQQREIPRLGITNDRLCPTGYAAQLGL